MISTGLLLCLQQPRSACLQHGSVQVHKLYHSTKIQCKPVWTRLVDISFKLHIIVLRQLSKSTRNFLKKERLPLLQKDLSVWLCREKSFFGTDHIGVSNKCWNLGGFIYVCSSCNCFLLYDSKISRSWENLIKSYLVIWFLINLEIGIELVCSRAKIKSRV